MAEKRREALTQARRGGKIRTWGEPGYAARLAEALDVSDEDPYELTHGFHPYAARMHPITARRAIAALRLDRRDMLFDPFCGSGTVLVEGLRIGLTCSGLDLSPLAVLISEAATWKSSPEERHDAVSRARRIAGDVLAEGKAARTSAGEHVSHRKQSEIAREILQGAFAPHMRREVEALAGAIDKVKGGQRNFLRAVLSSIVVKVSKKAGDRNLPRGMAARLFVSRAEELASGLDDLWRTAPADTPAVTVYEADARAYERKADGVVDAIITSPPYPGTYDYAEQHELPMALLGMLPMKLKKAELGARRKFEADVDRGLLEWSVELTYILKQLRNMLSPLSKIIMLMGDSVAGKSHPRAVRVEEWIPRLATDAGLTPLAGAAQQRDKLGSFETRAFGKHPKEEHLILLLKE